MPDEKSKKAFPLRISPRLFEQVREWADQDLRSINGQIEFILATAVRNRKKVPGETARDQTPDPENSDASQ